MEIIFEKKRKLLYQRIDKLQYIKGNRLDFHENEYLEFKNFNVSDHFNRQILVNTIIGFLNNKGGYLLIGIDDNCIVQGCNVIKDSFLTNLAPKLNRCFPILNEMHLNIEFNKVYHKSGQDLKGLSIIVIRVLQQNHDTIFHNDQQEVYVKQNASNLKLEGRKLIDFVIQRQKKDFIKLEKKNKNLEIKLQDTEIRTLTAAPEFYKNMTVQQMERLLTIMELNIENFKEMIERKKQNQNQKNYNNL